MDNPERCIFLKEKYISGQRWVCVISDVYPEFIRGFGSCNIRPPRSRDPFGFDHFPL